MQVCCAAAKHGRTNPACLTLEALRASVRPKPHSITFVARSQGLRPYLEDHSSNSHSVRMPLLLFNASLAAQRPTVEALRGQRRKGVSHPYCSRFSGITASQTQHSCHATIKAASHKPGHKRHTGHTRAQPASPAWLPITSRPQHYLQATSKLTKCSHQGLTEGPTVLAANCSLAQVPAGWNSHQRSHA